MKRVILIAFSLLLLLFCYNACKPSIDEVDQIATMVKVWGFLKYYHPGVMNGSIDWDNQLIISLEKIDKRLSLTDFDREIVRLISQAGELEISKNKASESKDRSSSKGEIIWMEDFSWLEKDRLLDKSLKEKLRRIKDDVVRKKQYYVQSVPGVGNTDYKNEKPYADMTYPSTEFRLLALARFWNIINYFYPYKLIMDKNWHEVLTEFIPKFKNAQNAVEYHLAVLELTTRLNDTHASARSKVITDYFGNFLTPFRTRCIEGKMVVTRITWPSLNSTNDIKVGDIIKKIEGRDISDMLPEALHYRGASNEITQYYLAYRNILQGKKPSLELLIERENEEKSITIQLYPSKKFRELDEKSDSIPWRKIDLDFGYVDMGRLKGKDVANAMDALKETKGIIFDIRNYPDFILYFFGKYLYPESVEFAKSSIPDLRNPGAFFMTMPLKIGPNKKNEDYYKGKIVILVDETTVSRAEFTCMALQSAPDVKVIGSQTGAADGNVSFFLLPGGISVLMTGIGIFYHDGRETQRVGIVPDIVIKPTIKGLQSGRDEVLEGAVHYLRQQH